MRQSKYTTKTQELLLQRTIARSTAITKMVKYVASSGAAIVPFWFMFRAVESLSGSDTSATISVVFDVLKNLSVARFVGAAVGVTGVVYGLLERRIRVARVSRLADRVKVLERELDADRQSSRVNQSGSARPEDK